MPVIEAQCASILVPHDHRHINHESALKSHQIRRYLEPVFWCFRCSRRGCFVCIFLRGERITWTVFTPQVRCKSPFRCCF